MFSIPLESEEMKEMESDGDGFCGSESGYRFESRRGYLMLVVDIRSFEVRNIAESRVTSTIGTCYSMHNHPHRIVSINLVAFIQFLHVWFGNFEVDEYFKEDVQNFKKGKIWGFEPSLRIAWTQMYKEHAYSEYPFFQAYHWPAPDNILLSKKNHIEQTVYIHKRDKR